VHLIILYLFPSLIRGKSKKNIFEMIKIENKIGKRILIGGRDLPLHTYCNNDNVWFWYIYTKEKVDSVKDKAKALKDSSSEDSHKALKHKAAEKVKETKEKAAEKMNSAKDNVKSVVDSAKININKADANTLQQLSGIGEKKAQAIIDYRNKVGKIKDIAELSKIDGLGSTTIEKIAPFLSF